MSFILTGWYAINILRQAHDEVLSPLRIKSSMLKLTRAGYQPVPLQRNAALRTANG
jgi:hypothetical protein